LPPNRRFESDTKPPVTIISAVLKFLGAWFAAAQPQRLDWAGQYIVGCGLGHESGGHH